MCARACVRVGVRVRVCSPLPWWQPQNSRQSQKRGIFLSALALAAGVKQVCSLLPW